MISVDIANHQFSEKSENIALFFTFELPVLAILAVVLFLKLLKSVF